MACHVDVDRVPVQMSAIMHEYHLDVIGSLARGWSCPQGDTCLGEDDHRGTFTPSTRRFRKAKDLNIIPFFHEVETP